MSSFTSSLLCAKDNVWRLTSESSPSILEMRLYENDKSDKYFKLSRPSIFEMLLNDKSSHFKLTLIYSHLVTFSGNKVGCVFTMDSDRVTIETTHPTSAKFYVNKFS